MAQINVADDLTVHVLTDDSAFEFFLPSYDPESMAAFASASEAYACAERFIALGNVWQPYKSPEEREQERNAGIVAGNKVTRNALLSECDWTQLADVPITVACLTAFQVYRQALRDADMLNPVWPDAPAEEWA